MRIKNFVCTTLTKNNTKKMVLVVRHLDICEATAPKKWDTAPTSWSSDDLAPYLLVDSSTAHKNGLSHHTRSQHSCSRSFVIQ